MAGGGRSRGRGGGRRGGGRGRGRGRGEGSGRGEGEGPGRGEGEGPGRRGRRGPRRKLPSTQDREMEMEIDNDPLQPQITGRKRALSISSDDHAIPTKHQKTLDKGKLKSNTMVVAQNVSRAWDPSYSDVPRLKEPTMVQTVYTAANALHPFQDFDVGDIVWVKSQKKNVPAWPGKVVGISQDAPPSLLSAYDPGSLCVMLFGHPFRGDEKRDHVWARPEMMFPFLRCLEVFQGRRLQNERTFNEFRLAIEEATLTEYGFMDEPDKSFLTSPAIQSNSADDEMDCSESHLYKYKQFCDICRRVCSGDLTERGRWLHCHKCNVWCHSGCDLNSTKYPEAEYMCPKCQIYFEIIENKKKKKQGDFELTENDKVYTAPYRLTIVCRDTEADYLPKNHLVLCECDKCEKGVLMGIGDWERHVECRHKKWKISVKVKGPNILLIQWLTELHEAGVRGLAYFNPELGEAPISFRERDLIISLLAEYQPYKALWSIGTCATCLSSKDDDQNKIIICHKCQVAVHQDCYGAKNVKDTEFASWVCRACETPDIKRECCLCPVVGGALKPTTTHQFWVHVTCAWLVMEVFFPNEDTMEPADGIMRVDRNSFKKVCVICNQMHGSCLQCYRCSTSYHAMCAALAGYWIQLRIYTKDKHGRDVGKWISYCAQHKTPNSHHSLGLIFQGTHNKRLSTPKKSGIEQTTQNEMLAAQNELGIEQTTQNDILAAQTELGIEQTTNLTSPTQTLRYMEGEEELTTVSRCRAWPWKYKKKVEAILHRPMGFCRHPPQVMETLNCFNQQAQFSSFRERLSYAQQTERKRVCFGKSGIHGYGVFARIPIFQGEMVLEYRGEKISKTISDVRETLYKRQGIHCYLFKITEDIIIDATKKGNLGRLINHSCAPNLSSKIIDGEDRIELIAIRDIAAGEELNFNYDFQPEEEKIPCFCGAPNCRKFMT